MKDRHKREWAYIIHAKTLFTLSKQLRLIRAVGSEREERRGEEVYGSIAKMVAKKSALF